MKLRVGYTAEQLQRRIESGEMQIHTFPLGVVITEIKQFPEERVLMVQLLAGSRFAEWAEECVARLREFAKQNGCVAVEATCRLGLEPLLKPLGWKKTRVHLRNEI